MLGRSFVSFAAVLHGTAFKVEATAARLFFRLRRGIFGKLRMGRGNRLPVQNCIP